MSTGALDPLIHDPERLRVVATLAALPGSDALAGVADADRDAAAAALGEHFAQGRLTLDELSTRLDATLAATTHGELFQAARDLP